MAGVLARLSGGGSGRRVGACAGVIVLIAAGALLVSRPSSAPAKRLSAAAAQQQQQQTINAKVNSLLSRMTVAEKFGQLESPLHIPLIFGLDVIHGYKTIFPVPLAEASSWDMPAIENDESVSADEATADGIKWTFNPMVDISRDPRWGRVVEGAGEDPYLGSAVAVAKVDGYQGGDIAALDKMAATVKHFGGYGAVDAGRESNTVDMSGQQLFNDYRLASDRRQQAVAAAAASGSAPR